MVDGRVVERPHDGHRFFQPELWNCWWNLVNWRTVNWEGRGVWCGKSAPPRLQPPSMAVKDRWVGPASKYSTYWSHASVMGPASLVVSCQQKLDSPPLIASLVIMGEKLGTEPQIGQPSCCGSGREPFFSGSGSIQICWRLHEKLLYVNYVRYV
jgi:hypothetical protein